MEAFDEFVGVFARQEDVVRDDRTSTVFDFFSLTISSHWVLNCCIIAAKNGWAFCAPMGI